MFMITCQTLRFLISANNMALKMSKEFLQTQHSLWFSHFLAGATLFFQLPTTENLESLLAFPSFNTFPPILSESPWGFISLCICPFLPFSLPPSPHRPGFCHHSSCPDHLPHLAVGWLFLSVVSHYNLPHVLLPGWSTNLIHISPRTGSKFFSYTFKCSVF